MQISKQSCGEWSGGSAWWGVRRGGSGAPSPQGNEGV